MVKEGGVIFGIWVMGIEVREGGPIAMMREGDEMEMDGEKWRVSEEGMMVPVPCPYRDN